MDIVADKSIFLAVVLDEPEKDRIIQLTSETDPIAPEILPYEIGNALSAMINRKQITQDEALSAQKAASVIPVWLINIDVLSALKLAIECNIYAYYGAMKILMKSFYISFLKEETLMRKKEA